MTITQDQFDTSVRRQVFLEGFKASEAKRYDKFLRKMDKVLREKLGKTDLTEFGRQRVKEQLKQIRDIINDIYTEWGDQFEESFLELAQLEMEYEIDTLTDALDQAPEGFSFNQVSPAQLKAAVKATPLSVRNYAGDNLLDPFIRDFKRTHRDQLIATIRQGYFEGLPNHEILKQLRGIKGGPSVFRTNRNHALAIIRTSIQHVAGVARFEVWKENSDILKGYRWVSTLDLRTTQVCRSLDGQVFEVGKGPRPPIHIGCRSTTIAEFEDDLAFLSAGRHRASPSGKIKDMDYYRWLKTQPKSFQDMAIGPTRAKLFRDGGLTVEEFRRLNLDRNFQPMTLEQMRAEKPKAFERADIAA